MYTTRNPIDSLMLSGQLFNHARAYGECLMDMMCMTDEAVRRSPEARDDLVESCGGILCMTPQEFGIFNGEVQSYARRTGYDIHARILANHARVIRYNLEHMVEEEDY